MNKSYPANPHVPRGQGLQRGEPVRMSDDEKRGTMLAERVCDGLISLPAEQRRLVMRAIAQRFCTDCGEMTARCACREMAETTG